MSFILILSNSNDAHVDFVVPELERRNLDFKISYTDRYSAGFPLESRLTSSSNEELVRDKDGTIDANAEIGSIWYRRPLFPAVQDANPLIRSYVADEIEGYTSYFFAALKDKLWVSYPHCIEQARNKILQIEYAKKAGFSVPSTLITSDIRSFRSFYEAHRRKAVIKSIKGHWYSNIGGNDYLFFTSLLEESKLPTKESLEQAPCLFQEYIDKKIELRATVVGDQVFTAALHSQENDSSRIDWRLGMANLKHTVFELPDSVKRQLLQINRMFGLNFGAYDLIVNPKDEYIFLELNPNGQWGWVQERTGLPIRESLIDLLQAGAR